MNNSKEACNPENACETDGRCWTHRHDATNEERTGLVHELQTKLATANALIAAIEKDVMLHKDIRDAAADHLGLPRRGTAEWHSMYAAEQAVLDAAKEWMRAQCSTNPGEVLVRTTALQRAVAELARRDVKP